MYGDRNEVTSCMEMVLPVRAALEGALSSSHKGNTSGIRSVIKRKLRKHAGIVSKKQWWNRKSCKQECSRDWRADEKIALKAIEDEARKVAKNVS